jgi:hypothetical protein
MEYLLCILLRVGAKQDEDSNQDEDSMFTDGGGLTEDGTQCKTGNDDMEEHDNNKF